MTIDKRQIVLYSNDAHAPSDLAVGENIPVIRGDGPREGDTMGTATITQVEGGLQFKLDPPDESGGES